MTETAPNRLQPNDDLELRRALDLLVPAPRVSDRRDWSLIVDEARGETIGSRLRAFISRRLFGGRKVQVSRTKLAIAFAVLTAIVLPALALGGVFGEFTKWSDPTKDWKNSQGDFEWDRPPSIQDPAWLHPFPPQLKDSGWAWVADMDPALARWYPWGDPSPDYPISEIASGTRDGVEWKTFVYASKKRGVCAQTLQSNAPDTMAAGCLPVVGVPAAERDGLAPWFDELTELWFEPTKAGGQTGQTLLITGGPVAKEVSSISIHFPSGQEIEATITPLPAEIGLNASWWTATFPVPEEVLLTREQRETFTDTRMKGYQDWLARRRQFIYTARSADGTVLESINNLGEVTVYQPPSESVTAAKG